MTQATLVLERRFDFQARAALKAAARPRWGVTGVRSIAALALAVLCAALATGCDGPAVKTNAAPPPPSARVVSVDRIWLAEEADAFLDGAARTAAWTFRHGRSLHVRCFEAPGEWADLDIRYTIHVPMTARLAEGIQKAGPIELAVSIDGRPAGLFRAQAVRHDFGLSFLAKVPFELVDRIAAASEKVQVVPRQKDKRLDDITTFGAHDVAKRLAPVRAACTGARPSRKPPREVLVAGPN